MTLFASADSQTARLVACAPRALRLDPEVTDELPHHLLMIERVRTSSTCCTSTSSTCTCREVSEKDKPSFLGNASALFFPIDWPEPFCLVMIEAMSVEVVL